jgi:hypothetical protein
LNEVPGAHQDELPADLRTADRLTRWLLILIGIPVVLIATGYLVAFPLHALLRASRFYSVADPLLIVVVRVAIALAWLALSGWLIRLMWPGPVLKQPG